MGQVAQADGVEPEHVVQSVVQAGGDQQTVEEGIQASADAAHASDALAQSDQCAEDDGPSKQQDHRCQDGHHSGDDGDRALAAEECQPVRQLGALELVVAGGADDSSQDADESVASDLLESDLGSAASFQGADDTHDAGAQQLLHHQVADQARQTSGAVMVIGQADSCTNSKQPSHIVDQSAACLDQQEADGLHDTDDVAALHRGGAQQIAQTHQDAADRQSCNGQHQGLAQFLEIFHHKTHSSLKRMLNKCGCDCGPWLWTAHTCLTGF